jgi:tripartite-type tricarboxylate transporter receptor subunit TctC
MTDLISGQVPIVTPMAMQTIIAMHRAGQIRVLAVASEQRLSAFSEIPTAAEQGYPTLLARLFVGLFAPAKTDDAIIAKISSVSKQAMADPKLQKKFISAGFELLSGMYTAAAQHYVEEEKARWTPLLQRLNLRQN